jgi:Flp pilus assembly protein TadD
MSQGQYEEAQYYLRKTLEIDPQNIPAMKNLGAALAKLGRQEEANVYSRKAGELEQARAVKKQ